MLPGLFYFSCAGGLTDVEHANNALSPIFNKEKEQKRLKQAQMIGEIGAQVMDIVRGELKAQKPAEAKGDATVERPKEGDPTQKWEEYKKALTESPTYKAEMQKYGTGSDFQRAAEAALKKGDVAEASKLLNKASDEIAGSVAHTGAAVNLDEVNRLKFDPHAGKSKLAEGSAATELQNTMGGKLERVDPDASGADFVFSSGPNKGKTVDFMFTTAKGSEKEIEGMNKFFNNNWDNNVKTLHQHLEKADIVPLDFRNLTPANQQRILEYLNTLPASQKNQIVIMR